MTNILGVDHTHVPSSHHNEWCRHPLLSTARQNKCHLQSVTTPGRSVLCARMGHEGLVSLLCGTIDPLLALRLHMHQETPPSAGVTSHSCCSCNPHLPDPDARLVPEGWKSTPATQSLHKQHMQHRQRNVSPVAT